MPFHIFFQVFELLLFLKRLFITNVQMRVCGRGEGEDWKQVRQHACVRERCERDIKKWMPMREGECTSTLVYDKFCASLSKLRTGSIVNIIDSVMNGTPTRVLGAQGGCSVPCKTAIRIPRWI